MENSVLEIQHGSEVTWNQPWADAQKRIHLGIYPDIVLIRIRSWQMVSASKQSVLFERWPSTPETTLLVRRRHLRLAADGSVIFHPLANLNKDKDKACLLD